VITYMVLLSNQWRSICFFFFDCNFHINFFMLNFYRKGRVFLMPYSGRNNRNIIEKMRSWVGMCANGEYFERCGFLNFSPSLTISFSFGLFYIVV
jgi:hypothetical protein